MWCSTGLSKLEILAQGFLFFLAGYDTVSDALALLLYCLAIYPDIQERAQEEVDAAFGEKVGQRTRTLQWGLHICVIKSPTTPLFFSKIVQVKRKYQSPELLAFCEGNPTATGRFPSQRAIHDRGFPWHGGIMWWKFPGGSEGIGIQIWWLRYFSLTILTSEIKKKEMQQWCQISTITRILSLTLVLLIWPMGKQYSFRILWRRAFGYGSEVLFCMVHEYVDLF